MIIAWVTEAADEIISFTEIIFQHQFMFVFKSIKCKRFFSRKRNGKKNNLSKIYKIFPLKNS